MGEKKHFAALGAAAAAVTGVGIAQQAEATIVYSGVVNINVPATTAGIYLNVVNGASGTAAGTPGWDFNPYATSTGGSFFTGTGAGPTTSRGYVTGQSGGTSTAAALNMGVGDPIGAGSTYNTGIAAGTNFTAGTPGLVGFRFQNEANGNAIHYGWARISVPGTSTSGTPGTIIEYAYEDVAGAQIGAGVVPEPASLGLLALGAMGLVARRR